MITIEIINNYSEFPFQNAGMQIWHPNLGNETKDNLEKMIIKEWEPFGYNYGILVKNTNTLHLFFSLSPSNQ